jgi:RNA polymerase sigma-B factor
MNDSDLSARNAALVAELVSADPAERDTLLERLVVANMVVARSVARRYAGRSSFGPDLEQIANLALVRAAQDFDPARGCEFLAYAVPCMTGAVRRFFRDSAWVIRPPRPVQERHRGFEGRDQHVADAVVVETCFRPRSLDQPTPGDLAPLVASLPDDDGIWERTETRLLLEPHLRALTPRARRILHLRFVEDRTQQEIGAELGIHQVQVSRLLAQHLRELRGMMADAA